MKKLSLLDLAFFAAESEASPKHVAGLLLCRKPKGAPQNFGRTLVEELKTFDRPAEPFNLVINFAGVTGPHWQRCENFSIDQHVFYHGARRNRRWEEVLEFVSRLHDPVLDRSRPLWEFHLIDRVEGARFAVYLKIHHAYADGMTMTSWLDRSLSETPDDLKLRPVWTLKRRTKKHTEDSTSLGQSLRGLGKLAWNQMTATSGLAKLSLQLGLERLGLTRNAVALPFSADEDSPLIGCAVPGRQIATADVPMHDVRRICKATRSTLNHVALTCIDGALHRYLKDIGHPLDRPITIQMPVNLRRGNEEDSGNKLGIVLVDLARPTDDPFVRLREIGFALRNVRSQIDGVPAASVEQYTLVTQMAAEVLEKTGLADRLPANGHTLVSNVPGPRNPLYMKGARVEHMYPISTLAPGLHSNITLFSFAGVLHFGIVATRSLEHLQNLAYYIEEEFQRLEEAVFNPDREVS